MNDLKENAIEYEKGMIAVKADSKKALFDIGMPHVVYKQWFVPMDFGKHILIRIYEAGGI